MVWSATPTHLKRRERGHAAEAVRHADVGDTRGEDVQGFQASQAGQLNHPHVPNIPCMRTGRVGKTDTTKVIARRSSSSSGRVVSRSPAPQARRRGRR